MCLIKGKERETCNHETCLWFARRNPKYAITHKVHYEEMIQMKRITHYRLIRTKYSNRMWLMPYDFRTRTYFEGFQIPARGEWPSGEKVARGLELFDIDKISLEFQECVICQPVSPRELPTSEQTVKATEVTYFIDTKEVAVYIGT